MDCYKAACWCLTALWRNYLEVEIKDHYVLKKTRFFSVISLSRSYEEDPHWFWAELKLLRTGDSGSLTVFVGARHVFR